MENLVCLRARVCVRVRVRVRVAAQRVSVRAIARVLDNRPCRPVRRLRDTAACLHHRKGHLPAATARQSLRHRAPHPPRCSSGQSVRTPPVRSTARPPAGSPVESAGSCQTICNLHERVFCILLVHNWRCGATVHRAAPPLLRGSASAAARPRKVTAQ